MLTVQQAVFTVESLISKVQQQKQLITHQQQVIEQLLTENKQLRKENEQLTYRVQELEARTKKNSSNSHLPPSSDRFEKKRSSREPSGKKPGGQEDMRERHSVKWNIHTIVSFIASIRVKDVRLLCVT